MEEMLRIRGGRPLAGTVPVPAAKNSVLPLLAACVLCRGAVQLHGVPRLSDVRASVELLGGLGVDVQWSGRDLRVQSGEVLCGRVPEGPARSMRSSVFYLAPLLHRVGWVTMVLPGGCDLGPRPIDIHLDGLSRMGAQVTLGQDTMTLRAPRGLCGVDYTLRLPSVGATETLLMAASCAAGTTVLRNAACEPEIRDLADFLNACGACIQGAGSPVVVIRGAEQLHGADFAPMPDRITVATVAAAVASAGGDVTVTHCCPEQLWPVLRVLEQAGCGIAAGDGRLRIVRAGELRPVGPVYTGAYPEFPTDAAPLAAAAVLRARGRSCFCDRVFADRFACAAGFKAMGACVCRRGSDLEIDGVPQLRGAVVTAPDLRGGAALVMAALAARGESWVRGLGHIRRGYEDLGALLRDLGADVRIASE